MQVKKEKPEVLNIQIKCHQGETIKLVMHHQERQLESKVQSTKSKVYVFDRASGSAGQNPILILQSHGIMKTDACTKVTSYVPTKV